MVIDLKTIQSLGLSDEAVEKTAIILGKAQQLGLGHGYHVSTFLDSAIYIACKELGTPKTISEICGVNDVKQKALVNCAKKLISGLELEGIQVDEPITTPELPNISFKPKENCTVCDNNSNLAGFPCMYGGGRKLIRICSSCIELGLETIKKGELISDLTYMAGNLNDLCQKEVIEPTR